MEISHDRLRTWDRSSAVGIGEIGTLQSSRESFQVLHCDDTWASNRVTDRMSYNGKTGRL